MAVQLKGITYFKEAQRDEDRHREYKIEFLVHSTTGNDGPANVIRTPGLPVAGAIWNYHSDLDIGARCYPTMKVAPFMPLQGEKPRWWTVECTFGTRPIKLCSDADIDNPLLEPQKISGDFSRHKEEATEDRFGSKLLTSSHEVIRGPNVEFDYNRPSVEIEQNVANLQLALCTALIDHVNDRPLWGVVRRGIKLSDFSWERKYHGTCFPYYTRKFRFDVAVITDKETGADVGGFDRKLLDEGSKALNGRWDGDDWALVDIAGQSPNKNNPQHFTRVKDRNGENIRVILDGAGKPWKADYPTITNQCANSLAELVTVPQTWKITGMVEPEMNIEIDHVAACAYLGVTEDGSVIRLDFDPDIAIWTLEALENLEQNRPYMAWSLEEEFFNHGGKNVMVLDGELVNPGPSSVQIAPAGGTKPGSIDLEFYDEGNFLLLGIPLTL